MRDLVYLLKLCTNLPLLLVCAGIVLEEEDQPEPTESGAFHLGMASHVATKRGREGGREGEKIERESDGVCTRMYNPNFGPRLWLCCVGQCAGHGWAGKVPCARAHLLQK